MKLKYYLRGLGIGIIVTAILMGIATKDKEELTDAEIKAKAAELGMVEQKVLADIGGTTAPDGEEVQLPNPTKAPEEQEKIQPTSEPKTSEEPLVTATPENTETPASTLEPENTTSPEPTPEPTEQPTAEPTKQPATEQTEQPEDTTQTNAETMTVTIKSGETSWSISQTLFDLGMVESASEFDRYLCQNGFDKTIRIGTFEIPKGATYSEIAHIIAR